MLSREEERGGGKEEVENKAIVDLLGSYGSSVCYTGASDRVIRQFLPPLSFWARLLISVSSRLKTAHTFFDSLVPVTGEVAGDRSGEVYGCIS